MKHFYFALFEFENNVTEAQGKRIVAAMNEFKDAFNTVGKAQYYKIKKESEYRRVEKEIQEQLK